MIQTVVVFAGVCFLLAMVPGPGAMVILRQAIGAGRRPAFLALAGNETALMLWGLAAATGLTALITASEVAYSVLRVVGAAVLLFLGVQAILQSRRSREGELAPAPQVADRAAQPAPGSSPWRSYSTGLVTNLTNPKAAVFALSFLPQFVHPGAPVLPTVAGLGVVWALVDALWFTGVIWFIGRARVFITRPSVWRRLTRLSGIVLIALGLRLAAEVR
jgi:threonine/homoserine/homoserine lactone efflux protein